VTPFFLFALLFLILPTGFLIVGGFQDAEGHFTLANIGKLFQPSIRSAYWISIEVSTASAIGGAVIGFFLAYAGVIGGLPRWIRPTLITFCGVASNFAGLPLAFAFLATLGRTGLVTALLVRFFDFNIYSTGFNLLSFWGLALTYLYFQIPLMVLILTPALDGLKREWREASAILGASGWQYWRLRGAAGAVAEPPRHHAPALRQRLRRHRHRLRPHRQLPQYHHHPALRADPRRRAARPEPGIRPRVGDDRDNGSVQRCLYLAAQPQRAVLR